MPHHGILTIMHGILTQNNSNTYKHSRLLHRIVTLTKDGVYPLFIESMNLISGIITR